MSPFNRRQFLSLQAAAVASLALPATTASRSQQPAGAATAEADPPASGFYRFSAGDMEVTVLSDGHFHFPMEILPEDVDPDAALAYNVEEETRDSFFRARLVPEDHIPLQMSPVLRLRS